MDINTRQLRYFMELAKCLNFTKAAMNLYLAQPALSQQIADLEKQLGVTLFERNSRSVTLTPAGEILQSACPEILSKLDDVQQQLLRAKAGLRGCIKIGYLAVFQPIIAAVLQDFRRQYPDIALEFYSGSLKEVKTALDNGDIDIAFAWINKSRLPQEHAPAYSILWQEDLCIAVSKVHPFTESGGTDYSLLENETFIMVDDYASLGFTDMAQEAAKERGIVIKKQVNCKPFSSIIMQVEAGMGVSILPGWMRSYSFCAPESIAYFPIKRKCMDFGIAWYSDSKNAVLPLFMDMLDKALNPPAEADAGEDLATATEA